MTSRRADRIGGPYALHQAPIGPPGRYRLTTELDDCCVPYSELEMWRKSPAKPSGRNLEPALNRTAEISGVGVGRLDLKAHVPRRRIVDLARYRLLHHAHLVVTEGTSLRLAEATAGKGVTPLAWTAGNQLTAGREITCPPARRSAVRPQGSPDVP